MRHLLSLSFVLIFAAAVSAQSESVSAGSANDNYLILSTKRIGTMEKELAEAGSKGFRVLYGSPTQSADMALFLQKGDGPVDYKILATARISTMEKELNEAGREGFRLLPRTINFKAGFVTAEYVMVMQRDKSAKSIYAYDLVEAAKEVNLQKKIDETGARGFVPVTMITVGKHIVVTEKASPAN
jgi:hypothetical protein